MQQVGERMQKREIVKTQKMEHGGGKQGENEREGRWEELRKGNDFSLANRETHLVRKDRKAKGKI